MANRLWIIIVRNRRGVRKFIRGYLAELNDSELADAIDATEQPAGLTLSGTSTAFQRPVVSAPIPTLGGERLAMWGAWQSVLPAGVQTTLDALEARFPNLVRTFKQQGTGSGDAFTPSEEAHDMVARVKGLVGWIDQPRAIP